ncbi:bacteriocin-type signal sequence-containing protein [Eubacterium ruminantium]|nr:bacteriocin-type signal sequence-containing protein [Eubacterium ruminantium]
MSAENVKKFKKDFNENEELKEKIKKELEAFKDSGKKEKELIPEIARKLGYDFTDEEFKEEIMNEKELSAEELANVSGGYFGLDEDAPDGHEATCLMYYYDCMDDYYYSRGICKYCGSRDITWLEGDHKESMKCWTCGSRLYKDW